MVPVSVIIDGCTVEIDYNDEDTYRPIDHRYVIPLAVIDTSKMGGIASNGLGFVTRDGAHLIRWYSEPRPGPGWSSGHGPPSSSGSTSVSQDFEMTSDELATRVRTAFKHLAVLCGATATSKEPF